MQPLLVVLLSAFWLGEGLERFEIFAIVVAFIAASIIIRASSGSSEVTEVPDSQLGARVALFGLIFNPLLLASGQIAMRKMVNVHHFVVSSYLNFSVGIAGAVMVWILGESFFGAAMQFDWVSWVLIVAASWLVMVAQTAKFLALQNYPAGKLQILAYFALPVQFFIDTVFFGY